MTDNSAALPIPKIVGRGKNRFKTHSYNLRSSVTRCQSSQNIPCQFCTHFRACHEHISSYNRRLRFQLFRVTTRALVIERWRKQKDDKIAKLRGLLQERSEELHEKKMEIQGLHRDTRLRKDELRFTLSELERARNENASLQSELGVEKEKTQSLEQKNLARLRELQQIRESLSSLLELIAPLLESLANAPEFQNTASDTEGILTRVTKMQESVIKLNNSISANSPNLDSLLNNTGTPLLAKLIAEALCGVCHELFIDPVALPCGHVFCEFCIRMWLKRTRGCPVCRHRLLSCSQLHAIYSFREVVQLLNQSRRVEDQQMRAQELTRREANRDELYTDPVPRRSRDRSSSSTDRGDRGSGERFANRRRRLDYHGIPPVPYPIPMPNSRMSTARLDIPAPRPLRLESPYVHPPMLMPEPQIQGHMNGQQSAGNLMSSLLNETFTNIDRLIRGTVNPSNMFPIRAPLNMIEYVPQQQAIQDGAVQAGIEVITEGFGQPTQEGIVQRISNPFLEDGSPAHPIVVQDEGPRTPPGEPPEIYHNAQSDTSEGVWTSISRSGSYHGQEIVIMADQSLAEVMELAGFQQGPNTEALPVVPMTLSELGLTASELGLSVSELGLTASDLGQNPSSDFDLDAILNGDLLSSSSRSGTSPSEYESEATETTGIEGTISLEEIESETDLNDID